MTELNRRSLLATAALAAPALLLGAKAARAATKGTFNIGYQKASVTLVLAKAKGVFEAKLAPLGWDVTWAEFTSGPPMLEALAAGAVNFAFTGEPPVIFAQAANTGLVYVAATNPSPSAIGILKPAGSKLTSVAELKGKTVAVAKGSSAHYLLVSALAHAGVDYNDVNKVFLQPADARAAFSSGAVDAWSIWDPFYAGAQAAGGVLLTDGTGLMPNRCYLYLRQGFCAGASGYAECRHRGAERSRNLGKDPSGGDRRGHRAGHRPAGAGAGTWFGRQKYGVYKLTPEIFAGQQKIADAFFKLGLIPQQINVSADAWIG